MNFKLASCICIALTLVFLSDADLLARGMGGGRGGGARGGMSRGGASMSRGGAGMSRGGASRSRGGVSASRSSAGASRGGVTSSGRATAGQRGTKSASGPRGGSVTVGGARGGVKGPSGGAAGRAGGVQVTGPGGRTATKGGAQAGARGPGGAVGGQARGRSVGGSRGSATGRQTRTAGRSVSTDAGFSKYRGGVSVRGGSRRSTAHRTRSVTATTRRTHGTAVRRNTNVRYRNRRSWYGRSWYARYPNAWRATRLSTAAIWSAASWNSVASYFGSTDATEPVYYDYGNTIVYEGDTVYNGTEQVASAEEYYQEASEIADAGSTEVDDDDDWMSLGVWAMVKGDEEESNNIIQLAVNKDGLIRGNHYNALKDETTPIQGSVNKETQRAAWTIGDNSKVISETGIYNLTQDETDMLIHYGSDKTQQWSLVRLESPETEGIAD